jgi:hypothetical protein
VRRLSGEKFGEKFGTKLFNLIHDVQYVIRLTWQKITNRCSGAIHHIIAVESVQSTCLRASHRQVGKSIIRDEKTATAKKTFANW